MKNSADFQTEERKDEETTMKSEFLMNTAEESKDE